MRPAEARALRLVASELTRPGAVLAPFAPEFPLRVEDLHAMIPLVRDVHGPAGCQDDPARLAKLPVPRAAFPPFAEELAGLVVDLHLVLVHERQVDVAVVVHGQAADDAGLPRGFVQGEIETPHVRAPAEIHHRGARTWEGSISPWISPLGSPASWAAWPWTTTATPTCR